MSTEDENELRECVAVVAEEALRAQDLLLNHQLMRLCTCLNKISRVAITGSYCINDIADLAG